MAANKRLFLSLSEDDVLRLDCLREELGMNRSQYIRYVLSGQQKLICPSIKYMDAVKRLSSIDLSLRTIVLKDSVSEEDKLAIYSELQEIKKILSSRDTFGQVDRVVEFVVVRSWAYAFRNECSVVDNVGVDRSREA